MGEQGKEPPSLPYGAFEPKLESTEVSKSILTSDTGPKRMPPPGLDDWLWPKRLEVMGNYAKRSLPYIAVVVLLAFGYFSYNDSLNVFVLAVRHRALLILEGSAGTVVLFLIEKFALKVPISKGWYAAILLGFVFFGCFQAWEQEYVSRLGRETDLRTANQDRDKWKQQAQTELAAAPAKSEPERVDSLRRRTRQLAEDIDQFLAERNESHPPRSNGVPNATGEQAEINKKSEAYDGETNHLCLSRYETKILGIPKELYAKGLPTQWLHTFDVNNNLRCLYGGNYPNSETQMLRDLSYRLDAHDMPVEF